MGREKPAKKKVRADPHRVMAWLDSIMVRPVLRVVLAAVLLGALVILLSPKLLHLDRKADTLTVGKPAPANIKATREFTYLPPKTDTVDKREKAAAAVPSVFDLNLDMGETLSRRVKRAFAVLSATDGGVASPTIPRRGPETKQSLAVKKEQDEAKRRQFCDLLEADVPPKDFAQIQTAKYVQDVRAILLFVLVVDEVMKDMIVSRRGDLAGFKGKLVTVRRITGGKVTGDEEKVTNLGQIKDLKQVRAKVRERAEIRASRLPAALTKVVPAVAQSLIKPNLKYNNAETERRRDEARRLVKPITIRYAKGRIIVREGDSVSEKHIHVLDQMEPKTWIYTRVQIPIGVGIFILCLLVWQFRFATLEFRRFYRRPRDLLAMAVLLLGLVGLSKSVVAMGGGLAHGGDLPVFLYAIPIAAGAMLVRLLITAEAAAIFGTAASLVCGLVVDQSLAMTMFYLATGLAGASGVSQVQSRSTILRAGLWAGLVGAAMVLGFQMFREQVFTAATFFSVLAALAGGLLTAFVTLALLPAMEWLFAYTTDVTLLELANLNHPLLRDLILHAPGTYHHSMIVGNLSEGACESIGANGLLARVGSYYHDIGKSRNAEYFAENFRPGDNPHNRLKPSMSGLIIRSHVKDTMEMLREHSVSEMVIDAATQHHGTACIESFFHKAKEAAEPDEKVSEEDYRYPGPKPQTREAGVLMLADGVEAAARSLSDPTEDRLQSVVSRVINSKFTDGQLDHCDLTLRDLHNIAKSFLQVLRGIYHQRPTYPWQKREREEGRKAQEESKRETARHLIETVEDETEDGKAAKVGVNGKQVKAAKQVNGKQGKAVKQTNGKQGKATKQAISKQSKDAQKNRSETKAEKKPQESPTESPDEGKTAEGKGDRRAKRDSSEQDQPGGERQGAKDAAVADAEEDTTESNPDLKRLGLG